MRHEWKPAIWAALLLTVIVAGCQLGPNKPPTTLEILTTTESALTAGWETLGEAAAIGAIDVSSVDYMRFYTALERADNLLDSAWVSYENGSMGEAQTQAQIAAEIYRQIRPLLIDAAESH